MFGGFDHLSAAAEAKARKERQGASDGALLASEQRGCESGAAAEATLPADEGRPSEAPSERELKAMVAARAAAAARVAAEVQAMEEEAAAAEATDGAGQALAQSCMTPAEAEAALRDLSRGFDAEGTGNSDDPIPSAALTAFFKRVHAKLGRARAALSATAVLCLEEAARDESSGLERLSTALVRLQRACFFEGEINVEHGCGALGSIEVDHFNDFELWERRQAFFELCRGAFLTSLRDAKAAKGQHSSSTPGELTKSQIELILETGGVLLQSEKAISRLSSAFSEAVGSGGPKDRATAKVAQVCLEIQYEAIDLCGVDRTHGVQALNGVQARFGGDRELLAKMASFAQQCERSVASATVPRAARAMEEVRQAALGARQRAIERSDAEERQRKGHAALVAKGGLSKGQVLAFFAENQRLLDLPETRERYARVASRSPDSLATLNAVMVEDQRSVFPRTLGVTRKVGRAALEALPATFGADDEVEGAVKDFAENCARVWLAAARQEEVSSEAQQTVPTPKPKGQENPKRKPKEKPKGQRKLQASGEMARAQIVNFLDGCLYMYMLPETRAQLRELYLAQGGGDSGHKAAARESVKLQTDLLEALGVKAEFGISCLNRLGQTHGSDQEVVGKMQHFQARAQQAVVECRLSDAEVVAAREAGAQEARDRQAKQAAAVARMRRVEETVLLLSAAEKEAHKSKMAKKWATLTKLPPQSRQEYLSRQPETDQLDVAMMSMILQQERVLQVQAKAAKAAKAESGLGQGAAGTPGDVSDDAGDAAGRVASRVAGLKVE